MTQLPRARHNKYQDLRQRVPHCPPIQHFTQIPKIRLSFTLILLFPPDILQLQIQIPDLARELRDMSSIMINVRSSIAYDDVKVESDVRGGSKPGGRVVRRHADGVVA